MILRNNGARDDAGRPEEASGIEDIARRLDELVQAVSNVSAQVPAAALREGVLPAARRAWRARRERQRIFGPSIVTDPAWDILLDLFIARLEERPVTVSDLGSAIAVSKPTALRWIAQLIEAKLVASAPNASEADDRRLQLTDEGLNLMCDYFLRTGPDLDVAAA